MFSLKNLARKGLILDMKYSHLDGMNWKYVNLVMQCWG